MVLGRQPSKQGKRMSAKTKWGKPVSSRQPEIVIFEPLSDSALAEALKSLRERKVVVAELESLSSLLKQRAADCLAGCVCAIDGQTRWLGAHTLLCTPSGVKVTADKKQ